MKDEETLFKLNVTRHWSGNNSIECLLVRFPTHIKTTELQDLVTLDLKERRMRTSTNSKSSTHYLDDTNQFVIRHLH